MRWVDDPEQWRQYLCSRGIYRPQLIFSECVRKSLEKSVYAPPLSQNRVGKLTSFEWKERMIVKTGRTVDRFVLFQTHTEKLTVADTRAHTSVYPLCHSTIITFSIEITERHAWKDMNSQRVRLNSASSFMQSLAVQSSRPSTNIKIKNRFYTL